MKSQFPKFVVVLLMLISAGMLNAKDDFEKAMLKAKKNLFEAMEKNNESGMKNARGQFERILQLKKDPWLVNYYVALADYGLAMTGAGASEQNSEGRKKVKQYTESGIATLQKSIDEKSDFAEAYVLMEALNFNRWQYEQEKMQEIISATQSANSSAAKLEPNNPRLALLNGISAFWTPASFGGGPDKAVEHLEKSLKLFSERKEKSELHPDWGKDLALGYMAMSMSKTGDNAKAAEYLETGMKEFPDSGFLSKFVKEEIDKSSK